LTFFDLTERFGRGSGVVNLGRVKRFYLLWPRDRILQTVSEESFTASCHEIEPNQEPAKR